MTRACTGKMTRGKRGFFRTIGHYILNGKPKPAYNLVMTTLRTGVGGATIHAFDPEMLILRGGTMASVHAVFPAIE